MNTKPFSLVLLLSLAVLFSGCQSAYYGAMEKMGVHKRDIMVDRVKAARDSQEDAKQQFTSALEQFKSVVNVKGGDLEAKYNKLNAELQKSEKQATEVRDRIEAVENVSNALFKEWKAELKQYSDQKLRKSSQAKLEQTQAKYKQMMAAMKKAESKIDPVLNPLRDQVLFLKHNLNAEAISSLSEDVASVQLNVDQLIQDMEASIAEANQFINAMGLK
ncbi:MAG: DUF2959 domain-containing protein [Lentisphaerota bacterium]